MNYQHEVERNGAVISYCHHAEYDARWYVSRGGNEVGTSATFTEACLMADGSSRTKRKSDDAPQ
jgi:hypothetical protein